MRRATWLVAAVFAGCGGDPVSTTAPPPATVRVERGELSSMVSQSGTLAHRGSYAVINQANGIYTRLPAAGDVVACGDVLYRVDDDPVLLLCGPVPAYRDLRLGDRGQDVRQLNRALRLPRRTRFTRGTERALERLQRAKGAPATGELELGDAVVLPRAARIDKVTGKLGAPARTGAPLAQATSGTLEVQVDLEPSQQGAVKRGDRARITLPGLESIVGTVDRLGSVATAAEDGPATVPAYISLDDPGRAQGLDRAPVRVEITTTGVKDALSVPVTALMGRSGGGFAVEVVRDGGRRDLVAVGLGLFDTANGRVEVSGTLAVGDRVVVPSL